MKNLFLSLLSVIALSNCSKDKSNDHINMTDRFSKISSRQSLNSQQSVPTIQVLNQFGQPVQNAKVLIGSAVGQPFQNNLFVTDKNGSIQNLNDWTTNEHVTADAPGFVRQTLLTQQPGHIIIKLNPAQTSTKLTITGQVTQLTIVDRDKNIDFGLVMAAMTRTDILNFDLNSVISPINDIMKVAGNSLPVPTNVSLPKQKENYIIGITIEKPEYRYFSQASGTRRLFAAAGRFPFKTVVDELRTGKPFYDVINYFDLRGGGIRDVTSTSQTTTMDIPGNELEFTKSVSIASPNLNADEIFVALTASEVSGFLIPTGIRKMAANTTTNLNVLDNKPAYTVNVIKRQSEFMTSGVGADRLSAALLPYSINAKPNMLPLVNNPSVTNPDGYLIQMPTVNTVGGIFPLAVSAIISDIEISGPANSQTTNIIRKWEILGQKWPTQIQLPNWPLDTTTQKRFEINYVGGLKSQTIDLGDELIKAATHVTHSSTDF